MLCRLIYFKWHLKGLWPVLVSFKIKNVEFKCQKVKTLDRRNYWFNCTIELFQFIFEITVNHSSWIFIIYQVWGQFLKDWIKTFFNWSKVTIRIYIYNVKICLKSAVLMNFLSIKESWKNVSCFHKKIWINNCSNIDYKTANLSKR